MPFEKSRGRLCNVECPDITKQKSGSGLYVRVLCIFIIRESGCSVGRNEEERLVRCLYTRCTFHADRWGSGDVEARG